ncbi:ABC transporter [Ustulina deusta]|nr:ABC transporter [Ustulina deusta]
MDVLGPCPSNADLSFGPAIDSRCRDGFDFTLLFEESILSLIPAALFILVSPLRLVYLVKSPTKAGSSPARFQKLAIVFIYGAVELSLLVLRSVEPMGTTVASLPSAVLNLVAALLVLALTELEDAKSLRPSFLLHTYLLFTLILDLPQARTLWLTRPDTALAAIFTTSITARAALLLVDSWGEKRSHLQEAYQTLPPESRSGIINRSFLWWMNGLFRRSLGSLLTFEDLYVLDEKLASGPLSGRVRAAWGQRRRPERRLELPLAICRELWWPLLLAAIARLALIGFTFAQPFLIFRVLDLLSNPSDSSATDTNGYGLVGATFFIYLGIAISTLHYNQNLYRFVTMFRGATVTLIYDHLLLLPVDVYDKSAALTLMSTDVDQIILALVNLNECWARLIEVLVGVSLLALRLSWVSVVPVLIVLISFYGSTQVSKTIGGRQKMWIDAVQNRINIIALTLTAMRSLRMSGLSRLMTTVIQDMRVDETCRMSKYRWSTVWQNLVQNVPWALAPPLTFIVYAAQAILQSKRGIGTTQAFTSLSIITLLTNPAARLLGAIPSTAASLGCLDRIQKFLTTAPRTDERITLPSTSTNSAMRPSPPSSLIEKGKSHAVGESVKCQSPVQVALLIDHVSLRPTSSAPLVLEKVSFAVTQGSLTMIIGSVGSGKTTLLKAIVGELSYEDGIIRVLGCRMAYSAQPAWLPNVTIFEAITGPVHDGQDLDKKWYDTVLHACALDHDISLLPKGDQTLVGSAGTALSGGQQQRVSLARSIYARASIILLDDVLASLDSQTQESIMSRLFGSTGLLRTGGTTVLLVSNAAKYLTYADKILVVNSKTVIDGGSYHKALGQGLIDGLELRSTTHSSTNSELQHANVKEKSSEVTKARQKDDLKRAAGDFAVYKYYFQRVGWAKTLIFVSFVILNVGSYSFGQIWLSQWAEGGGTHIALYLPVYITLAVLTSIGQAGYVWAVLVLISPSTARKFHSSLLRVVMRARQSFFTTTEIGAILNRFSQDMTLIENQLAIGVLVTVSNLFLSAATAGLVAAGSSYMALSVPVLIITVGILQYVYLRTSRQLRLLDLEARSPLYTHFLETLGGLSTVRAFGWQEQFKTRNEKLLDLSQKPYYLLYCIQRWLNLVLDLIVGAEAVLVVGLALGLRHTTSPGLLGVSLNNILSFNVALSSLVSGWTVLETSLGSIARLKQFEADVEPEDKGELMDQPPPHWPDRGAIEFCNVTAHHGPSSGGIQAVNLRIEPGQWVGVCGRTGSGKSSLLGAILGLLNVQSGRIIIDGIDISTIPRNTIRERLLVVPQEPFILAGSVRFNVDPHGSSDDDSIAAALERVGLRGLLVGEHGARGLCAPLTASSLSKGEQQLLALARLLLFLKKHKHTSAGGVVLLLDEPTSDLDAQTDATVQRVLREELAGATIVIVAHRLTTIMDSDLIVVMDAGRVVEVGEPGEILRREPPGWFARLTGAGDEGSSEKLGVSGC